VAIFGQAFEEAQHMPSAGVNTTPQAHHQAETSECVKTTKGIKSFTPIWYNYTIL